MFVRGLGSSPGQVAILSAPGSLIPQTPGRGVGGHLRGGGWKGQAEALLAGLGDGREGGGGELGQGRGADICQKPEGLGVIYRTLPNTTFGGGGQRLAVRVRSIIFFVLFWLGLLFWRWTEAVVATLHCGLH